MDEFGEPNEIQFDYSSVIFDRVEDISQQLDLHLGQLERLEEAVKPVNWLPRINTSVRPHRGRHETHRHTTSADPLAHLVKIMIHNF